jgi:hypothetical protein
VVRVREWILLVCARAVAYFVTAEYGRQNVAHAVGLAEVAEHHHIKHVVVSQGIRS